MWMLADFDLFLFDFDGLLVNTEEIHFEAYRLLCRRKGYHFPIDFATYQSYALFRADAIRELLYELNPGLESGGAPWKELYLEKKAIYSALVDSKGPQLMTGAAELIEWLSERGKKSAIVTHSMRYEVEKIRERLPILKKIDHLITREDYEEPKPSPECYETALRRLARPESRTIGFEDSPRGLMALLGTSVEAVLVSAFLEEKPVQELVKRPFRYVRSLSELVKCG